MSQFPADILAEDGELERQLDELIKNPPQDIFSLPAFKEATQYDVDQFQVMRARLEKKRKLIEIQISILDKRIACAEATLQILHTV